MSEKRCGCGSFASPPLPAEPPREGKPWDASAGAERDGLIVSPEAQLAQGVTRLLALIRQMEARMAAQEAEYAQRVTITHDQARALLYRIRLRSDALCAKHRLDGPGDAAYIRAQIKKAVLQRNGIRDLHDLPLRSLDAEGRWIDGFTDYKMVMKRREARKDDHAL